MASSSSRFLHRLSLPWLIAVVLVTTLPHGLYQPSWLMVMVGVVLLSVAWHWRRGYSVTPKIFKVFLVMAGAAGIVIEYRTLLGRDAGVAMLVYLIALKLLELKSRRDALVIIILGYFLLLTHYFYSQSIPTGLWLLGATLVVTGALVHLHGDVEISVRENLKFAGQLLLQALPLMVVLYLLFPRINGPLWGIPQDAHAGKTGLSNNMAPGNLSELVQSNEIAFRVRFDSPVPERRLLYWRGPVLERYDGKEWLPPRFVTKLAPSIEALGPGVNYSLTLEAHNERWLLPLDLPVRLPNDVESGAQMDDRAVVLSRSPIRSRQRVDFTSSTAYRLNIEESADILRSNLQLPPGHNPRSLALAKQWVRENPDPENIVLQALSYFRDESFFYTLRPPLLGENGMDDFLFATRRGFCEHYASAFVTLMRGAGVPARVVTGYQGAELNPVDGFYIVRQSDAHAWAEVWIKDKGWVRVDPTAAVAPDRIERGVRAALPEGEPLPTLLTTDLGWLIEVRNQWEAMNNRWNQWVLGYNPDRQKELLDRLGLNNPGWKTLVTALMVMMIALLLILAAWTFRPRRDQDQARVIWKKAIRRLEARGISCPPWETPLALAQRLNDEAPELAPSVLLLAQLVMAARYQDEPPKFEDLQDALQQLYRK